MNVLSLFDGISCGRLALQKSGFEVGNYYSSEIDKYAIKVSTDNWPSIKQMGDVLDWKNWDLDWGSIDLILAGSPCQGFSMAGKQLAFDDERSKLFFVFEDILNHIQKHNPNVKFILENVKMKREFLDIITDRLGVEPISINSSLVSGQNRFRWYWVNWEFEKPQDKNIKMKDILQDNVDEKYICKEGRVRWLLNYGENKEKQGYIAINPLKSKCLTVRSEASWNTTYIAGADLDVVGWPSNFNNIKKGFVRRLTPVENERLQTVPDNYTSCVSDAQRYKLLGNGWTVDVVSHILNQMEGNEE